MRGIVIFYRSQSIKLTCLNLCLNVFLTQRDLNAMVEELEMDFRRQEDELIRRRDELDQRENQLHQREIRTNAHFHFNEQRTIYLHKFERTLMHRE